MADSKEYQSLIRLLDDESSVYDVVQRKLLEMGPDVVPSLLEAAETGSPLTKERAKDIAERITIGQLRAQFRDLVGHTGQGDIDLERGMFIIARYQYPMLDVKYYTEMLNSFAAELDAKLAGHDDPDEILYLVNDFFIKEKKFQGNKIDYYNPDNSYINRVLDSRMGIPISLCIVYLLIARRLNIPLVGIGMPSHFLLNYTVGPSEIFIDPFNGGQLLTREQCIASLDQTGFGYTPSYLEKVSNRYIIERVLRNLALAYTQQGDSLRARNLITLNDVL
ncbi:MAG: transglutaminase-like domain-containing protein [Bacteroidota bacterium]